MSRKRLSWLKKSDPYTMNQEREQPPADDYWIGGPSEFAETPHPELPDDPELGRDEIGRPNMSERNLDSKNVDEWGADDGRPYDNQPYWPDEGPTAGQKYKRPRRQRRANDKSQQRQSARDMYSRLKKKAFQCVKISSALLPSASESTIEEQAFELMALPDDVVISTAIRLADEDGKKDDKEEEDGKEMAEDQKEDKKEKKEADLMLQEMLEEEKRAEGHDDDEAEDAEEDHDDDDEKESADAGDIDQMVNDMMGEDTRRVSEQPTQPQQPQRPAPAPQPSGNTDFDIQLEPTMNTVSAEDVSLEENNVLQQIWGETIPEGARESHQQTVNSIADRQASQQGTRRRTANNQGVQTLGGGVKQSSETDDDFDLSKLWSHAPDVSDVMND